MAQLCAPAKFALVTVLFSTALSAQQQPSGDPSVQIEAMSQRRAELAKEWLQSSDPLHIAWGAAIARQETLRDLSPLLLKQITAYPAVKSADGSQPVPASHDGHDAMLVVLDTAIIMELDVPVESAADLYGEFPAQSLILLARSFDKERLPALLEIFRATKTTNDWLAAGNILVTERAPGFAAVLLKTFTKHLQVTVTDPGRGAGFGGGIGSCCGVGMFQPKTGWPAVGHYVLATATPNNMARLTLLVDGDTPVYFHRVESKSYVIGGDCGGGNLNRDALRAKYLARLVGQPDLNSSPRSDLNPNPYAYITYENETQYQRELLTAIVQQRSGTFRVIRQLAAQGLLSEREAVTMRPRVEVTIYDARTNATSTLPKTFEDDEETFVSNRF